MSAPIATRSRAPIGVFDSGLGGLTVVRQILASLPHERVVYIGDTEHVPYGGRPLEEISRFALGISRFLVESAGCKALVMACNISSAVARDLVQATYPELPVLGVIGPGARTAAALSDGAPVAVLATEGTVRSGAYARALRQERPEILITETPCPEFVPLVEAGQTDTPEADQAARRYLDAATAPHGARTVILGCTHYPFLLPALTRVADPDVVFVDPAGETARELGCVLQRTGLASDSADGLAHRFCSTGSPEIFAAGAKAFLGGVAAGVSRLLWQDGRIVEDEQ